MPPAARLGDKAQSPADVHGCPACPHPTIGPLILGSPNVMINSRPAGRVGDNGVQVACCTANTWVAMQGSATVMINGKPALRMGDMGKSCGGVVTVIEGAANVMVGG